MKYAPEKVFIKENDAYIEISYQEFCKKQNNEFKGKFFISLHNMLKTRQSIMLFCTRNNERMSVPIKQNVNQEYYCAESFCNHIAHRIDKADVQISVDTQGLSVNCCVGYILVHIGKTVITTDLCINGIYYRVCLHIAVYEYIAEIFKALPQHRNTHGQQNSKHCRQNVRCLIVLVEQVSKLCTDNGKDRSCQQMKQVIPPGSIIIEIIHRAKYRTKCIECEKKIERQVHSPAEKNTHYEWQSDESNSCQAIEIAEQFVGRKGNVDHRQKAEEAQCRGQGNLEHGKPEAV